MKLYALAAILVFCIVQNAAAWWQDDVKIYHWQQINDIINPQLENIRDEAATKGTPAAVRCVEQARQALKGISSRAYSSIFSCIRSSNFAGKANVCCQEVDSRVFQEVLTTSQTASACINKA